MTNAGLVHAGMPDLDLINRQLAAASFVSHYDLVASACRPGWCEVRMPYDSRHDRPGGIINGVAVMGIADVTMWLAIMTLRGPDEAWVTTDLKTAFLRAARRVELVCTAEVLKIGKRTAYGTAECRSPDGVLLSHHVLSYAHIPSA